GPAWERYFRAKPQARVPQIDTARHTADLIYQLSPYSLEVFRREALLSATEALQPGGGLVGLRRLVHFPQRTEFAKDQMVTVYIPLGQERTESVVPYSALVFDAFGGSWIYLDRTEAKAKDKESKFERRRVELGPLVEGGVVIWPSATAKEQVV